MSLMKAMQSEIARLARKEVKKELEPVKRVNATQRGLIANLRRDLVALQKEINQLKKTVPEEELKAVEEKEDGRQGFWMTGKGVLSLRKRLGLTQTELAELAGITQQTVVRWEKTEGKIPFRGAGIQNRMQEIRSMGKRDVKKALEKGEGGEE